MPYETPAATRRGFLSLCSGMMAAVGVAGSTPGLVRAAESRPSQRPKVAANGSEATGSEATGGPVTSQLPTYRLLPDLPANSMLDHLNCELFTQQLNTNFSVAAQGLDLVLVRARGGKGHDPARGQECFSLLFRGPVEPVLPQGTYSLGHPEMGQFDLFMVPLRQNSDGAFYEVIFNRLVVPAQI